MTNDYYSLDYEVDSRKPLLFNDTRKVRYHINETRKEILRIQKDIHDSTEDADTAKESNALWTTFFFLIPFFGLLLMWIGVVTEKKELAIFGFVFLFIAGIVFWVLFAIYLPAGVAATDYCDEPKVVLMKGLDHVDGDGGVAVKGCYNRVSIFKSLGHEKKLRISYYVDYNAYFNQYYQTKSKYNITYISMVTDYLTELLEDDELFDMPEVEVSDLGFQEEAIDQSLDQVNAITMACCDLYYDSSNITELDPNSLDELDDEQRVRLIRYQRTTLYLIRTNNTLYEYTVELNYNLTKIEIDAEYVRSNLTLVVNTTNEILVTAVIVDEAVYNVSAMINNTQDDIYAVAFLGDCSFLADDYDKISDSICTTTIYGVDTVWFSSIVIASCIFTYIWTSHILYNRVFIQPPFLNHEMTEFFSRKRNLFIF